MRGIRIVCIKLDIQISGSLSKKIPPNQSLTMFSVDILAPDQKAIGLVILDNCKIWIIIVIERLRLSVID